MTTSPPLPSRMQVLPLDAKRKLPIPVVNNFEDHGEHRHDFTVINTQRATELAVQHRCSVCGEDFDWWIAFLGSPLSTSNNLYSDPPMHPECARASIQLCPHINRRDIKRVPDNRALTPDAVVPEGFTAGKTDVWHLAICRGYKIFMRPVSERKREGWTTVFEPKRVKMVHEYTYNEDGRINLDPRRVK